MTSSGGDLISEADNPWFLALQPKVTYCVAIDEAKFHVTLAEAKQSVERALAFWHEQFDSAKPGPGIFSDEYLAQPVKYRPEIEKLASALDFSNLVFIEVPCNQNPDLRFQLGVLTDEAEITYVANSRPRVADCIRTAYDKKELRAKGSIYVVPPASVIIGRNRQQSVVMNKLWQEQKQVRLKLALIHELGHMFGLVHYGRGILNHSFLTRLVRQNSVAKLPSIEPGEQRLIFPNHSQKSYHVCDRNLDADGETAKTKAFNALKKRLGVGPEVDCLEIKYAIDGLQESADIFATAPRDSKLVGTSGLGFEDSFFEDLEDPEYLIQLTLPEDQTLFRDLPSDAAPYIGAYAMRTVNSIGEMTPTDKNLKPFSVRFESQGKTLQLEIKGSNESTLVFTSVSK